MNRIIYKVKQKYSEYYVKSYEIGCLILSADTDKALQMKENEAQDLLLILDSSPVTSNMYKITFEGKNK